MTDKFLKISKALLLTLILMVTLLLAQGNLAAQEPNNTPETTIAGSLDSKISYQGVLREDNELVTGTRDMSFRFCSDDACTAQAGETISMTGVSVSNGLFNIALPVDQSLFNGQALWLEVEVDGTVIGMSEILAAPYALNLKAGAELSDDSATSIFRAINTNTSEKTRGLYAKTYSTVDDTAALYGHTAGESGATYGVYGKSDAASDGSAGVYGTSSYTDTMAKVYGVYGYVYAPNGRAVQAVNDAATGQARAVYAKNYSIEGQAIYGHAGATSGETIGVYGKADSPDGSGVYGHATSDSGQNYGVYGMTDSASDGAAGVYGTSSYTDTMAKVYGLYGYVNAPNGRAVQAVNDAATGQARAVYAKNYSTEGQAVYGHAGATSGETIGVYGKADSPDGSGVYGHATSDSGQNYGVYGMTDSASDGSAGVYGTSSYTDTMAKVYGLYGYVNAPNGRAVQAVNDAATGQARAVYAKNYSTEGQAVYGHAGATSGDTIGLYGKADSPDGTAVYGYATAGSGANYGVYGKTDSSEGYAGYFDGNVHISGTLTTPVRNTVIDHPLDPENKNLVHASVEAPEMTNMYNGNALLDANGEAVIELPAYFEALNTDIRYQLTPIGGAAPNLYIAEEVKGNKFKIAGGSPGLKVSWQVTGVRHDPWAQSNPLEVEVEK